jgi:hypothetical protein
MNLVAKAARSHKSCKKIEQPTKKTKVAQTGTNRHKRGQTGTKGDKKNQNGTKFPQLGPTFNLPFYEFSRKSRTKSQKLQKDRATN